jgi:hypothetical protein
MQARWFDALLHGWLLQSPQSLRGFTTIKETFTMQAIRFSSLAALLSNIILATATFFAPPPAHAYPGGGGAFNGKGFDTCSAPSTSQMSAWWSGTPWSFVGVYIGGAVRACSQPNLTATWMNSTYTQGWRHEFIWVGPQAPCTTFSSRISYDTATAYQQGQSEASAAYTALINLGITNNASGTPVVYDMEGYTNDSACRAAVQSFMQGWVDQLAVAPAQVSGVYGSACNSYLSDLAVIARPPAYIWAANWDSNPSTSVLSCVSGSYWGNHQRLKQYQGDHNETWGGVTINIDTNCANGPGAPTGNLVSTSSCN